MDKYTAISEALPIVCPDYCTILKKYSDNALKYGKGSLKGPIDADKFIRLISSIKYNLSELGLSTSSTTKLLKELFPSRKTNSTGSKICTFILAEVGMKQCARCQQVLEFSEFRPNRSIGTGVNTYCKLCHLESTKITQAGRQSEYRAAKLNRTMAWSELEKIKEFFNNCPIGYHVDHIVPLQGALVSGLHVLCNLQYLPASENCKKNNTFTIG